MKYRNYKVIAKGFSYDYLTPQDSCCVFAEIGQKFKVLDTKVWFEMPDGTWRLTINWPDIIDLGLENKQLEQYKHKKMNKYYILYESYCDYTQFEGQWSLEHETFPTIEKTRKKIESLKESGNIRNVIGPLVLDV